MPPAFPQEGSVAHLLQEGRVPRSQEGTADPHSKQGRSLSLSQEAPPPTTTEEEEEEESPLALSQEETAAPLSQEGKVSSLKMGLYCIVLYCVVLYCIVFVLSWFSK